MVNPRVLKETSSFSEWRQPADMLEAGKEFVEKMLSYTCTYNSMKDKADKRALLDSMESAVEPLLMDIGISPRPEEMEILAKNPLHFMCLKKNPEILHLFLQRGANMEDVEDRTSRTPLHFACFRGDLENVQVLLYHGADTNARDKSNRIPLMDAIEYGSYDVVKELWPYLDKHEIDNVTFDKNDTLLIRLLKFGNVDYALDLLEMQPDVNVMDSEGCSALHYSCRLEDPHCFNAIFPRVSDLQVLDGFVLYFLQNCNFPESEFTVALYKIYNSSHVDCVMAVCKGDLKMTKVKVQLSWCERYRTSITCFLLSLRDRLGKDNLIEALSVFLSYGAPVENVDYEAVFQSGCEYKYELFDIISEAGTLHLPLFCPANVLFLSRQPGHRDVKYRIRFSECSPKEVLMCILDEHLQYLLNGIHLDFCEDVFTVLKYTAGHSILLPNYMSALKAVEESSMEDSAVDRRVKKILANSPFPSLVEFARDVVREKMISKCKCEKWVHDGLKRDDVFLMLLGRQKKRLWGCHLCFPYFSMSIRKLPIPQFLQNVLLLKVPLYNYSHLDI